MLRVPVGFEIGIDLGVDDEDTWRPLPDPDAHRIQVGKRSHRRGPRTVAARDSGKICFRKLHDIDRIALPAEVMHFGGIGAVIVNKDAQPQSKTDRGFEIRDRHQKTTVPAPSTANLPGLATARPITEASPSPTDWN